MTVDTAVVPCRPFSDEKSSPFGGQTTARVVACFAQKSVLDTLLVCFSPVLAEVEMVSIGQEGGEGDGGSGSGSSSSSAAKGEAGRRRRREGQDALGPDPLAEVRL